MKQEQFIDYLITPVNLNTDTINELRILTTDYPYCASINTLLTLNLFKEKNIQFETQLGMSASLAANRKVLRLLIDNLGNSLKKIEFPDEFTEKVKDDQATIIDKEFQEKARKDSEKIEELKARIEKKLTEIERTKKEAKRITSKAKSKDPIEIEQLKNDNQAKTKLELIDQFIHTTPSISRSQSEFYDAIEYAHQSIVDQENIVSETLAQIYYDQGYKEKSIKIYNKLGLKYPEKSSYFAAQIERIEKEI